MAIQTVNPASGVLVKAFDALTAPEIDQAIARSWSAFQVHRRTSFSDRARCMVRAAEILESDQREWGRLMTLEMGKPIRAAIEEALKCAKACRFYAESAERFLKDQAVESQADQSYVKMQPIGPVLAVMPWNFPFWQVFRFAAPALMAGNTGLLKHASNVPQCSLAIEEIFKRAGFGDAVFQSLLITSDQVGRVIEDSRVRAVTLTGSEGAGADVAARAGKAIKKTVLELGGSDPFIVMPSADLERTVETAVVARTLNNGQSCIAAKRFIVAESIADEFERRFTRAMGELKVGDPMDEQVQIGPLATPEVLSTVIRQVDEAVEGGAQLLMGGKRLDRPGNYYSPAIVTRVPKQSSIYREEVFGPVALLFRVKDLEEAIRLANDVRYGLGASLWSDDPKEHQLFVEEIESGAAFVNGMVASDTRLPFGGVKQSGYGRELSHYGILEFVNIKTVWIKRFSAKSLTASTE